MLEESVVTQPVILSKKYVAKENLDNSFSGEDCKQTVCTSC